MSGNTGSTGWIRRIVGDIPYNLTHPRDSRSGSSSENLPECPPLPVLITPVIHARAFRDRIEGIGRVGSGYEFRREAVV
jgi:hypothetical protein